LDREGTKGYYEFLIKGVGSSLSFKRLGYVCGIFNFISSTHKFLTFRNAQGLSLSYIYNLGRKEY